MNLNNAKIIISAGNIKQVPKTPIPHIVMIGRSNVGKSSFINKILGRKSLARTSSAPGKTATINFYEIDETVFFVDLPGYGYAKVSMTEREKWGQLIDSYLNSANDMRLMIQLIDIRHKPTEDDKIMVEWLKHSGKPFIVVCTKCDKISPKEAQKNLGIIREELVLDDNVKTIAFSAEKGMGKDEVLNIINHLE